jgi:Cft2 family RNA processing exonuclease
MDHAPEIVPHTEAHPLVDGEVRLLGASRQVTGAMTRIELGGQRVLVDCGVAQGRERLEFPDAARDVDAVVLTHGHLDHIGNVPVLLRLDGEEVAVRAKIATLKGLSAHADRKELLARMRAIPDARRGALHHGDVESQEAFAAWAPEQS